jgi:hypothetical protein
MSESKVFTVILLAIPASRIHRVEREERTFVIEYEDRTYTVQGE